MTGKRSTHPTRRTAAAWIASTAAAPSWAGAGHETRSGADGIAPQFAVQLHPWEMYRNADNSVNALFTSHLDAVAALGADCIRIDVGWSASQPTPAPPRMSGYNVFINNVLNAIRAKGVDCFMTVHQSPAWARPGTGDEVKQFPAAADSIRPWARWIAQKWGRKVRFFDFWNEPNLEQFAGPGQNTPERYLPLLQAFWQEVKAAAPHAKVCAPGVSKCDYAWLERCYALGLKDCTDYIGWHPYQGNQEVAPDDPSVPPGVDGAEQRFYFGIAKMLDVMRLHGDAAKPALLTEVGWSAHSNAGLGQAWQFGVGTEGVPQTWATVQDKAADYMFRAMQRLQKAATPQSWPLVSHAQVKLYTAYVAYKSVGDLHQDNFALLNRDGSRKPQAQLVADWQRDHTTRRRY
jgi:hypothetical protein